jgi:hypothetical protein
LGFAVQELNAATWAKRELAITAKQPLPKIAIVLAGVAK